MKKGLIIMLHGIGSNGDNLSSLGQYFTSQLKGIIFSSPNAPYFFKNNEEQYQWFSVQGITENNCSLRILEARIEFDRLLMNILKFHGFDNKLDQVIFVGFSQGSIMALDAVISGRWPIAGVVAFSGRLASPKPFSPSIQTPVLLIHGYADSVISWHESEFAAQQLISVGVNAKTKFEQLTKHTISSQGAYSALTFIADHLCH